MKIGIFTDYTVLKTGIWSTFRGLTACAKVDFKLYATDLIVTELAKKNIEAFKYTGEHLDAVFTHLDYTCLNQLYSISPSALFHVGDWTPAFYKSKMRTRPFSAIIKLYLLRKRLKKLNRKIRLAFVNLEETAQAKKYGFFNSFHLPIGISAEQFPMRKQFDFNTLCFTGAFSYKPNQIAATSLYRLNSDYKLNKKVIIAGYDAHKINLPGVEIFSNLDNISKFLCDRRPVYVSKLPFGSGAKNKIIQALHCACPVICNDNSIDGTVSAYTCGYNSDNSIINRILEICQPENRDSINNQALKTRHLIIQSNSWDAISKRFLGLLKIF